MTFGWMEFRLNANQKACGLRPRPRTLNTELKVMLPGNVLIVYLLMYSIWIG